MRILLSLMRAGALAALVAVAPTAAFAQSANLAESAWRLDGDASTLTYQSIKRGTVVETSSFAGFEGSISPEGDARIEIVLESVDTGVDIRNVRMRFLFFETYKFPRAVITARVDPARFRNLPRDGRMRMDLDYTVDMHGMQKRFTSPVNVTMIGDSAVSVASATPIIVDVASFGFEEGLKKLSEAVGDIDITPSATVSFDMVFRPQTPVSPVRVASRAPSGALESAGDLTDEECRNRFDVLSRTEAIYFAVNSARLDDASAPLLSTVIDIATRCPSLAIRIAGHTDSDGPASYNQTLSERRAAAVADYLVRNGVENRRLSSIGYGETQPAFPNDTAGNKSRNRRIEFAVGGG